MFLLSLGYVAVMSFYRLYAEETGLKREFSGFFLIYATILLLSRPLAGKLQDRLGDNIVCYTGIALQALGLLSLALRPGMLTIVFSAFGCAPGYGTLNSGCNAIACRIAPKDRSSYAVATFWVFCDGGMGIGPVALGAIDAGSGARLRDKAK